jgi:hypothetical protein
VSCSSNHQVAALSCRALTGFMLRLPLPASRLPFDTAEMYPSKKMVSAIRTCGHGRSESFYSVRSRAARQVFQAFRFVSPYHSQPHSCQILSCLFARVPLTHPLSSCVGVAGFRFEAEKRVWGGPVFPAPSCMADSVINWFL